MRRHIHNERQRGFAVVAIALVVVGVMAGGVVYIFKDDIAARFKSDGKKQEETAPVNNPFPTRPPGEPGVPQERSTLPQDEGQPIPAPTITATGDWHGNYTVTSSGACAGVTAGWEAVISETNGVVSGQFSADNGFSGSVGGTRSGATTQWNVGGSGSGVSFRGDISGNTISGTFTGPECPIDGGFTSGTFFGGRLVY